MIGEPFWNLPMWAIGVFVTLVLAAGHEVGVQIRRASSPGLGGLGLPRPEGWQDGPPSEFKAGEHRLGRN